MATQFGKYKRLEPITQGSFAEIFRCRVEGEAGFTKTVALKRILPKFSLKDEFVAAFIEVATVTAKLTHANICQILDFGCINGRHFAAMEYVEGHDLRAIQRRLTRQSRPLPLPLVLRVVLEVCKALEYAHEKRDHAGQPIHIVHRSICPSNVLVSFEGAVKLINFGSAKTHASAQPAPASAEGQLAHSAPEQIDGEMVDGRSDLFSLGVLTWELLTGQDLFVGRDDSETLKNVRTVPIRPPSELNPEVPEAIDAIVLRLLQRKPSQRYPSAEELHRDLEAFVREGRIQLGPAKLTAWMQELREDEVADDDPAALAAAERRKRPTPALRGLRPAAALHDLTPIALEGEADEDDEGTRVSVQSAELAQIIASEHHDEEFVEDDATHDFGDAAEIIARADMQHAASRGEVEAIEAADDDDELAFFDDDGATEIDMIEPQHLPGIEPAPPAEVVIPLPAEDSPAEDFPAFFPASNLPSQESTPLEELSPVSAPRRRVVLPLLLVLLLLVLAATGAAYYWGYLSDVLAYFKL